MEITGELEVDRVRGLDPARASPRGAFFTPEDRAHRRLARRARNSCRSDAAPVRVRSMWWFFFAGGRGCDRRNQDQFSQRPLGLSRVQRIESHFGLIATVNLEMVRSNPEIAGNFGDRAEQSPIAIFFQHTSRFLSSIWRVNRIARLFLGVEILIEVDPDYP